jgi:hypothetical protein
VASERFVLLGAATSRARWFGEVGRWSQSAAIPAEFVRCVSLAELRTRLASGRRFSAVLADGRLGGLDRDLVATASEHGCPVIVIDDRGLEAWREAGVAAVLPEAFRREELLDTLAAHAAMVGATSDRQAPAAEPGLTDRRTDVVTVLGPGGTGASTAAIALAEGLAMGELGLRRPRHYVTIRPRAFEAALDALQRTFAVTVCDVDPDLEGEAETGSLDVEERHLMSRAALARSSAVFVVGAPGLKGLFSLVRTIDDVLAFGTSAERIVPVVSRGPRSPRQRADITTALRRLLAANIGEQVGEVLSPLYLPERRVTEALTDGVGLPKPLPNTLAAAYRAVITRAGTLGVDPAYGAPTRLVPGAISGTARQEATHRE